MPRIVWNPKLAPLGVIVLPQRRILLKKRINVVLL